MRALLLVLALLAAGCATPAPGAPEGPFAGAPVPPGSYQKGGAYSFPLTPGALAMLPPERIDLPSAVDGVPLELELHRPDSADPVPVVLVASPYFTHAADGWFQHLYNDRDLPAKLGPRGFAVALLAVRGTADSGGCIEFLGPTERADVDGVVTWLGEQPWSNGNVGMVGLSYDGTTPWGPASLGNPHLRTVISMAGVPDPFALLYHNGTTSAQGSAIIHAQYATFGFAQSNPSNGRDPQRTGEGAACPASVEGLSEGALTTATLARDAYWDARDVRADVLANYEGSVLYVQGLGDYTVDPILAFPFANDLAASGRDVKLMLGQWDHDLPDHAVFGAVPQPYARWDWQEVMLRWFGKWLRGEEVALGPRVEVQDQTGAWRAEDAWPPADRVATPLYLAAGGALAREPGADDSIPVAPDPSDRTLEGLLRAAGPDPHPYNATPQEQAPCPACPRFETEPFEREMRIAGLPRAVVTVVPTAPSGVLSARLYVVDDAGETLVGDGMIDIRYADGTETPRAVTPGQPLALHIWLNPTDAVVPAGARLALVLAEGTVRERLPQPGGPMTIEVGGEASVLTVDLVERNGSSLFAVP